MSNPTTDRDSLEHWPERIWLQRHEDCVREGCKAPHEGETTWCQDKIHATDVEYVRADVRTAPEPSWKLECTGCGDPRGTNRPEPICSKFVQQDDGEGRVDTYCAACGHSSDCHEPVRAPEPAASQWQPISTFPRNGGNGDPFMVYCPFSRKVSIDARLLVSGLIDCAERDNEPCYYSHWREVPASPETKEGKQGGANGT